MGCDATKNLNRKRTILLEVFFKRIWEDGSFIHWVNPKTGKLNVKKVVNEVLNTNDPSVFSKWAQPYRDAFNQSYIQWQRVNGELTATSKKISQASSRPQHEAPEAFLEQIVRSGMINEWSSFDENRLLTILNLFQDFSCECFIRKIQELQDRVKELEAQIIKKDKKIALQAETVDFIKSVKNVEDSHYMRSIRNIYCYDIDWSDAKEKQL